MKIINRIVLISALISLAACSTSPEKAEIKTDPTPVTPVEKPFFNGENLDGWNVVLRKNEPELYDKVFSVSGGVIHVFAGIDDGYQLNAGKNETHGMIFSEKSYSRYRFSFDYKWGSKRTNNFAKFQYDAGAFYHVTEEKVWPKGLEYQVRYNHETYQNHTGDLWNLSGSPVTVFEGEPRTYRSAANGGRKKPHPKGEHLGLGTNYHALNGEWNHVEIIVMADQYAVHRLNGDVVNVVLDLPSKEGKVALQSETAEVFYRNIQIEEFTEDKALSEFVQ